MPPLLHLRLLGGFDSELAGAVGQSARISARKARALLAYLAMRPGRRESRDRLADLLWGDRSDAKARHNLRQCLVALRGDLSAIGADILAADGDCLVLDSCAVSVDALDFVEAATRNDLERAIALYRGEFLSGLTIDIEPFGDWMRLERDRLAGLATHALTAAAHAADAAGDGMRAITAAERLVGLNPLAEEHQRMLLRLFARHRSRDAALARAKAFVATLRAELDVEPEPETAQLVADIKNSVIPIVPPPFKSAETTPIDAAAVTEAVVDRHGPREEVGRLDTTRSWMWRAAPIVAAVVTVALSAVFGVPWILHEAASRTKLTGEQNLSSGTAAVAAANQQWRSPAIYRGAGVDDTELASAHRQALVVLPFAVDDSTNKSVQALAKHIAVDLINDLSQAPTIRVISARTSQLYGERPVDVAAIGAELGVHYIVEGSMRGHASRIGVNVALVDAKTRLQVWSARFDRDLSERFAVQDEIARGIARVLHVAVILEEGRQHRDELDGTGQLLAKGWTKIFRANETGGPGDAKAYFESVLRVRPDHPSALTGLAAHHVVSLVFEVPADRAALIARVEGLLARALLAKPQSSPAYYYLGLAKRSRGDLDGALESFAKAIRINPSHAPAYANAGLVLVRMGRPEEGLEHIRYAIRLSPKDPALASWQVYGGEAQLARGNDEAAIEWLARATTTSPRRIFARALLAAAYALKGDAEAAAIQVAEWKKLVPDVQGESLLNTVSGIKKLAPRIAEGLRLALSRSS